MAAHSSFANLAEIAVGTVRPGEPIRWREFQGTPSVVEEIRTNAARYPLKGFSSRAYTGQHDPPQHDTARHDPQHKAAQHDHGQQRFPALQLADEGVEVLGTGAVGAEVFCTLARAGVGRVSGVDRDHYDPLSHLTQPARYQDSGQPKAWVQAARAHEANPSVRVRGGIGYAQDIPLRDLRAARMWIVAGDNAALAYWTGQLAASMGKVILQISLDGHSASVIVRNYDLRDPESAPCPMCGVGRQELLQQTNRHSCALRVQPNRQSSSRPLIAGRGATTQATGTSPPISSAAAQIGSAELLKWLTGNERHAVHNEEFLWTLITHRQTRTTLTRSSSCLAPHRRWHLIDVDKPASEVSLSMLARCLGDTTDLRMLQVRSEIPWNGFTFCGGCGRRKAVRSFARLAQPVGRCRCGTQLLTVPSGARSILPPDDLRASWDRSLTELGLCSGEAVGMQLGDDWTYFFTTWRTT